MIMDLEKYNKAISDAIKSEIEAKHFYEKISERIKDTRFKELFKKLAAEEAKHEKMLTSDLIQGKTNTSFFNFEKEYKVSETIELPEVNENMDIKAAIDIAVKNEELSMKKYMALAETCKDKELQEVFLDLAAMERQHKLNVCDFMLSLPI
jgi:erythrin-vacuolar iron transport family protein